MANCLLVYQDNRLRLASFCGARGGWSLCHAGQSLFYNDRVLKSVFLQRNSHIKKLSDEPNWKAILINYEKIGFWGSMLFCRLHCLKNRYNLDLLP